MSTRSSFIAAMLLAASVTAGCGSESQASVTDPEITALKVDVAALTTRVVGLEGQFAGVDAQLLALQSLPGTTAELAAGLEALRASIRDTVRLRPATALTKLGRGSAGAKAALPQEVGTLISLTPADLPAFAATGLSLFSTTGYLYALPSAGSSVWANPVSAIHYASSDCSGQGYVSEGDVSELGAAKGTVFGVMGPESDQAQWFFQVPRGAAAVDYTFASRRINTAICQVQAGGGRGYAVQPNDPVVTGVPSGPFSAPIEVGPTS